MPTHQSEGENKISIFHDIIVSKVKQTYIPENKNIPTFKISSLHIHTRQRKFTPKDPIDNSVQDQDSVETIAGDDHTRLRSQDKAPDQQTF